MSPINVCHQNVSQLDVQEKIWEALCPNDRQMSSASFCIYKLHPPRLPKASGFSLPSIPQAQGTHWNQSTSQAYPTEHLLARTHQTCLSEPPASHVMHTLVHKAEILGLVLFKTHSGQTTPVLTTSAGSKILQIPTLPLGNQGPRTLRVQRLTL